MAMNCVFTFTMNATLCLFASSLPYRLSIGYCYRYCLQYCYYQFFNIVVNLQYSLRFVCLHRLHAQMCVMCIQTTLH